MTDHAAIRVLDASLNRATEGLRVVEDYVRFVLDDRHLTEQLKRLRHDLAAGLAQDQAPTAHFLLRLRVLVVVVQAVAVVVLVVVV